MHTVEFAFNNGTNGSKVAVDHLKGIRLKCAEAAALILNFTTLL